MIIEFIIDRIEQNKAVLISKKDNTEIVWPINKLPEDVKEGSVYTFFIKGKSEDTNRDIAKEILNEILDTKNE